MNEEVDSVADDECDSDGSCNGRYARRDPSITPLFSVLKCVIYPFNKKTKLSAYSRK